MARFDVKSFIIGILTTLLCFVLMGSTYSGFDANEFAKLRQFASRIQANGDLNMGANKIIMQGSEIFDDGSKGGGLTIIGGANRLHLYGSMFIDGNLYPRNGVLAPNANIDMNNKKILMLGSSIYDDGSENGGLQLRGGANRVHLFGALLIDGNLYPRSGVISPNANIDMNNKKILMLGSSIYDDGSENGGLQLRGGANRIHLFGHVLQR